MTMRLGKMCTGAAGRLPVLTAGILCGLLTFGGAVTGGCGSGSNGGSSDTTTRLVGFWSLARTSGGLSGNGYPVTPGMELLTFNGNGTFTRTISGQTTSGTYHVTQRKTSLSADILPVISYSTSTLPDVVSQVDPQHLSISEEAADGFNREYDRVVQTSP